MKFIKNFILILLFIFPISNSFAAMVTEVHSDKEYSFVDGGVGALNGIAFNPDGTKMFLSHASSDEFISEYNLSTPFDISAATYAGDAERCELGTAATVNPDNIGDMVISSDGLKMFFVRRGTSGSNNDRIYRYDLTAPYDISTCVYVADVGPDTSAIQNPWRYGDLTDLNKHHVQGIEINPDGTKIFLSFNGHGGASQILDGIREYTLSTPYDLSTLSHVENAGIFLTQGNPDAIFFSGDGKRIFVTDHNRLTVAQYSLSKAYDTSSHVKDGEVIIKNFITTSTANQIRALAFSAAGLKMFVSDDNGDDSIHEFDLVCPFNIIAGKCPPVTENSIRTGIAEAQIMIAKRTIDHSTKSALNRIEWIRRNKDNQNLTNLNLDFNFTNQMLTSLTKVIKTSATKKTKDKNKKQDLFYWNEGSIAVGRVGDTSISSTKKIRVGDYTMGIDQFTNDGGIRGLAFRVGDNNVDVGTEGSKLEAITYNLSFYTTTPVKNDTKYVDTVIGFGKLDLDFSTVLDGKRLAANRTGRQVYGTFKIKDEIKKNNFILIPSSQLDIGVTMLEKYSEIGAGAIIVEDQHINTRKLKTSIAVVQELPNDKYNLKRHGKIEYAVDMNSSSNFKYTYISDKTKSFDERLSSGAVHNVNGEIGIDIVMPDSLSIFLIYERNQALGSGHTDNIIITIGYLPNKKTNYAFKINGSDNLGSEYKISKNINDLEIDFKLNNQDVLKPNIIDEAMVNLKKIF